MKESLGLVGLDQLLRQQEELTVTYQKLAVMTQAVGIATTIKPSMEIRPDDPIGMMLEVAAYVLVLEAKAK